MAIWMMLGLMAAGTAQRQDLICEVKPYRGSPTLFVNSKPEVPMMFMGRTFSLTGKDWRCNYFAQAQRALKAGVRIHSFDVGMPWPRPGEQADFSQVDALLDEMASTVPEALFIPRIGMWPPDWWYENRDSERMLYDDGQKGGASVASDAWREDAARQLKAFVEHCENRYGNRIAGYHPCGQETGEWFFARSWEPVLNCMEDAFRRSFAVWLESRYGTEEELRRTWGDPDAAFDSITLPTPGERRNASRGFFRDPVRERRVVDFHVFQNEVMAKALESFAQAIKDGSGRRKLSLFFYGYYFDLCGLPMGGQSGGHLALSSILDCPDIDILVAPISYGDRAPGDAGAFMAPVDSIRKAGKLWVNEDDTRTSLCPDNSVVQTVAKAMTIQETQWVHKRNVSAILPRRMGCWFMDLGNEGWLMAPEFWENIGELRVLYAVELHRRCTWKPEIALVVDPESLCHTRASFMPMATMANGMRHEINRIGAPCAFYLLDDLLSGAVKPPLLTVFAGCFHMDPKERESLIRLLKGRTALWMYGSGVVGDDSVQADNMTALTGFAFEEKSSGPGAVEWNVEVFPSMDSGPGPDTDLSELSPRWSPDPGCGNPVVARFPDQSVAAAVKRYRGYNSVYFGSLRCPAIVLHSIARDAGVTLLAPPGYPVVADRRFTSVTAPKAGCVSIRTLDSSRVVELDMQKGETCILQLRCKTED